MSRAAPGCCPWSDRTAAAVDAAAQQPFAGDGDRPPPCLLQRPMGDRGRQPVVGALSPRPAISSPTRRRSCARPNAPAARCWTVDHALAAIPRDAFDYVWVIDLPPHDPRLLSGMTPDLARAGKPALCCRKHAGANRNHDRAVDRRTLLQRTGVPGRAARAADQGREGRGRRAIMSWCWSMTARRDGTWDMMRKLAAKDPRLVAVNLSRNHGHQLALTAGLDLCRGDAILVIDADLQDPPELLPEMMLDHGAASRPTSSMGCAPTAPARRRSSAPPPMLSIACWRGRPRSTSRSTPAISA